MTRLSVLVGSKQPSVASAITTQRPPSFMAPTRGTRASIANLLASKAKLRVGPAFGTLPVLPAVDPSATLDVAVDRVVKLLGSGAILLDYSI